MRRTSFPETLKQWWHIGQHWTTLLGSCLSIFASTKVRQEAKIFHCCHFGACCQLYLYCQRLCLYNIFCAKCKLTTQPTAVAKIPVCLRCKCSLLSQNVRMTITSKKKINKPFMHNKCHCYYILLKKETDLKFCHLFTNFGYQFLLKDRI